MAFRYASYAIPQAPESPLAAFMPAFEAGQQKGNDYRAEQALADLSQRGPYQQPQSNLASLDPSAPAANGNTPSQPMSGTVPDSYLASVAHAESGGDPNAVNKTTGATGTYQFLPSTWASLAQQHPDLGLTDINDPAQQDKAMRAFTLDNAQVLAKRGIAPSPGSLYAAHFLGADGAVKTLSAPDDTLVAAINPQAAQANPAIANMTVGEFKAWANQQGGGANGGYQPPTMAPGGQPAAVGDRATELADYQGMGVPPAPAAPGEPVLALAANGAPQGTPQPQGGPQQGTYGLPDRETMLALFRSPETRPLAIQMVQAAQQGQSPAGLLDMALKRAQVAREQQLAATGNVPLGYRATANGGLEAIPGGPSDPNNPLNTRRVTASPGTDPNDSTAADIAGAIESGNQPPNTTGLYRYGAAVRAHLAKDGFDLSTANEDWTATQKHLASLNSTQQLRLRQAVDFSSQSVDLVDQLADQWKGGQFPLLNKANLALAKQGAYGQQAASLATRLSASIADLTSELGTVYKGGNSSTDESLKLAAQNLDEDWSTDTIKDATDQIRKSLVYRQNSLKNVPVSGIPDSQYAPNAAADTAAATKTIGGVTYIRDANGDWYQQ